MTKSDRTRPGEGSRVRGVDAGGLTDFVPYDGRGFRVHKVLSTPVIIMSTKGPTIRLVGTVRF